MSNARTRTSPTTRKAARPASVRKVSSTARQPAAGETLADAALVLRKALGNKVDAWTDVATQRISDARGLVVRRAEEAKRVLTRSVKTVEARVMSVVNSDQVQSVRDAAQAAVKRVTRTAQKEVASARKAAQRVTRDASAQVRAAQKAVRREVAVAQKAVQQRLPAVEAKVMRSSKPVKATMAKTVRAVKAAGKPVSKAKAPVKAAVKKVSKPARTAVSA